jgi:DNA-binding transcriptional MerR regulator
VLQRLAVIGLAQEAGFTIAEIRTLLNDFDPVTPPGQSWQPFAAKKRAEIEGVIAQAERIRSLLDAILACACPTLDSCGLVARRTTPAHPTNSPP